MHARATTFSDSSGVSANMAKPRKVATLISCVATGRTLKVGGRPIGSGRNTCIAQALGIGATTFLVGVMSN
jgi:hypothetical protein